MVTISEAIRELRKEFGQSQQAFSTGLDMSIASIANYETGKREPDATAAVKLARAALAKNRPDLATIFEASARDAFGGIVAPIHTEDEHRKVRALQYVLFDSRFEHLRDPLNKLLAPVEAHLRGIERKLNAKSTAVFDALDEADKTAKKGGKK